MKGAELKILLITLIYSNELRAKRYGEQKKEDWKMDLVIKYDPKADILAMKLKERAMKDEKLLDSDIVLSFDKEGELAAMEVWDASKRGLSKILAGLANEKREVAETLPNRTSSKTG